ERVDEPVDDLGRQGVTLNGTPIKPGAFKTGLTLPLLDQGQDPTRATWKLVPAGGADKFSARNLRTIALVVTYATRPSF
ncbi:MAG TPA: hypothetical protein VF516_34775, partial [Kofleriaceae bacterium]